jgi:hypothetical protein
MKNSQELIEEAHARRVATARLARFHMTPEMTRELANINGKAGEWLRWACVVSPSICFWRCTMVIFSGYNGWAQLALGALFLALSIGLCYILLPICLTSIWRYSSNYHERLSWKYLQSYTHQDNDHWIDMTKRRMYIIWVKIDNSLPFIAFGALLLSFSGGLLAIISFGAGWGTTLGTAFFSGNWIASTIFSLFVGLVCSIVAITARIDAGHMHHHANWFEQHMDNCDKATRVEEVRMIMQASQVGTRMPAGSLEGNASPKKLKIAGEPVDVAVDNLPSSVTNPKGNTRGRQWTGEL